MTLSLFPPSRNGFLDAARVLQLTLGAPLTVRLTHSCPIVRAGLSSILSCHPDIQVMADGQEISRCSDISIAITDYATGVQAARCASHGQRVLVVTTLDKEWQVRHAMESGVCGYLLQGCSEQELVMGVRELGRGKTYMSASSTRSVLDSLGRAKLTPREVDVLRKLAEGGSDKLIARELGIGAGTVKSHVKHLLQKLEVGARTHAVVVAIERGLLAQPDDDARA